VNSWVVIHQLSECILVVIIETTIEIVPNFKCQHFFECSRRMQFSRREPEGVSQLGLASAQGRLACWSFRKQGARPQAALLPPDQSRHLF
jgi:hypothetical protein